MTGGKLPVGGGPPGILSQLSDIDRSALGWLTHDA